MPDYLSCPLATPKGEFVIVFGSRGIREIHFPGSTPDLSYPLGPLPWPHLEEDLKRYLVGECVEWKKYPLDTQDYPPFTERLLREVRLIPHGRVRTYREIAERAGSPKAWRAAGQALKANRHPIIVPCHRVVGSNGKVGGFSGPPGWKEMLLNLEKLSPPYEKGCADD